MAQFRAFWRTKNGSCNYFTIGGFDPSMRSGHPVYYPMATGTDSSPAATFALDLAEPLPAVGSLVPQEAHGNSGSY